MAPARLSERLTRDGAAIYDGAIRYMMLRPDVLMGMFARLTPAARAEAFAALQRSARENGGKSVQSYVAADPANREGLLPLMAQTAADLGWGRWQITGNLTTAITITVDDSPFARATFPRPTGHPVCAALTGILTATATALWPHGATVCETHCAAQEDGGTLCRFHLEPRRHAP